LPGGKRSPAGGRKSIPPDPTAKTKSIEVDIERVCVSHGDPPVGGGVWAGGVGMVTTVVIPIVRRSPSSVNSVDMFEAIQKRLAWLARFMILIAGGSGFYMLDFIDGWSRYSELQYWWIHFMTFVWALFMFVFLVAEPVFLHRLFAKYVKIKLAKTFVFVQVVDLFMLTLSLVAVGAAVANNNIGFRADTGEDRR